MTSSSEAELVQDDNHNELVSEKKDLTTLDSVTNFMTPIIQYFEELEQEFIAEKEETGWDISHVTTEDGLHFDEESIRHALIFCKQLQKFLNNELDEAQFKILRSTYPFYRNPQELLDKIKLLFMGSVTVKEKILRIYGAKAFGTYKVTKIILETQSLFEGLSETESGKVNQELLRYAEVPLKNIKNVLPRSFQTKINWTRETLAQNILQVLGHSGTLFDQKHRYSLIVERFREFILSLYGNPSMITYLQWKDTYLRYWLYEDLHRMDIQNMTSGAIKVPQYSLLKIKAYQQLDQLFANLDADDQMHDRSKILKKTNLTAFNQGEAYLPSADSTLQKTMNRARTAEKELLDSLNMAQIASIAESIHVEISNIRKRNELKGEIPSGTNTRSVDMGSEQKAEKKYMAATVKVHVEQAKEEENGASGVASALLQTLGGFVKRLKLKPQKEVIAATPETPAEPETIPRVPDSGKPLEMVQVDWVGYGKEFKSTIYESKFTNLNRTFFDSGSIKLFIYKDFVEFLKDVLDFYSELGYLRKATHKVGVNIDGRSVIKEFEDEVVYLRTAPEIFLALGRTPFTKTADPSPYFQLYHTHPKTRYKGTTKNIDYSRMVDGTKYDLESFESVSKTRPRLFQSLVQVVDSLPDESRDKHMDFLKGLYQFLEVEGHEIFPDQRTV
ncbi:MAG: hypothetical protein HQM14_04760 [SAR324 cluster bacterium]|nr:hypothetical protein [SAR324 cluster bacterium]